ncbi:MAG: DNA repair protein RadC [Desulfovibrionaceae bacterium]
MSATTRPVRKSHEGHRARLKQRLQLETQALQDYEILELLLGYVLIRKDTKPLAKELLARFSTLRGVMDARPDELQSVEGFGPSLANFMRLLREFMARYAEAPVRHRLELVSPKVVAHMARTRLAGMTHEECWIALVDRQNRLIAWERLQRGRTGEVSLQPRDVLELALERKACGIILVHNHPGGRSTPSAPDLLLTSELQKLAPAMGLRFLDHIIVTEADCYSLNEGGLL